jgi:hypothetical protein
MPQPGAPAGNIEKNLYTGREGSPARLAALPKLRVCAPLPFGGFAQRDSHLPTRSADRGQVPVMMMILHTLLGHTGPDSSGRIEDTSDRPGEENARHTAYSHTHCG